MKSIIFSVCAALATCQTATAIIYRHDVAAEQYRMLAAQPWFDCVGKIINHKTGGDAGTCVLIGDRYVLTAAHVMVEQELHNDTMLHNGKTIVVHRPAKRRPADVTQYHFRFNNRRYKGKRLRIPAAYFAEATKGQCDIALIELESPVKGVAPAVLSVQYNEQGTLATGLGFGASGSAASPEEVDIYGYKLAGQNMVDSIGGYLHGGKPALLMFDFDHPTQKQYNLTGSAEALALEFLCGGGDSGGGMFRPTKTGWELIGICSGSGIDVDRLLQIGYYGHLAKYTRVSVFNGWIQQIIEELESSDVKN